MTTRENTRETTTLAHTVAAKDLRRGDHVAVLSEIGEHPSFLWCSDAPYATAYDPVRVEWISGRDGTPLRVEAICLPFVFVASPLRKHRTLDVR